MMKRQNAGSRRTSAPAQRGKRCPIAAIYAKSHPSMPNSEADIERQVIGCWNFSSKRGWKVRHIFIDLGGNGSLMERANFQEMIKEGKTGKFDYVILCNLEDFCDSPSDLTDVTELLRQSGIRFYNVDKPDGEMIGESSSTGDYSENEDRSIAL